MDCSLVYIYFSKLIVKLWNLETKSFLTLLYIMNKSLTHLFFVFCLMMGTYTVMGQAPCAGTPVAGVASITSTCPTVISLAGYTVGANLSFQWQKRTSCSGGWTNLTSATGVSYSVPTTTTSSDFRAYVVCSNSGLSDTSNIVSISSIAPCYCASSALFTADEEILNVSIGTMNNSSTCGSTGGPGSIQNQYSNYTAIVAPPVLSKGSPVFFYLYLGTSKIFN
jgi:hypothetical protein